MLYLEQICQVETDALSRFNRTVVLTHDPFEIGFGLSC